MRRELLKSVDIVIPVYNAFESLTLCIDSIRKHTNLRLHRVIIINDCSPDKRIKPYLDKLGEEGFIIIHNEKNQGFSANVNIGMSYSDKNDVILLNSDTIVTKRWVEKIVECAYASKETGTVTPLSNSATIASVPVPFVDNPLPKGMSVDEFAELVEHCSFCEYPRITVAVGFCMYIKREVIEKVGLFDAETFKKGYGEENDFCSRAEIYGYQHVLCDNTLIYHEGTQSFQTAEKEQLMREHRDILDERYPKQMRENDIFCATNPQQYLRDNIKLHLALENHKKNILYLSHYDFREGAQNNCGGTQFHIKDLKEELIKNNNIFVVARDKNELLLTAYVGMEMYTFRFDIGKPTSFFMFTNQKLKKLFSMILNACRIDIVHIQNVMGLSLDMFDAAKELKLPLCLTLHDYYFVCPNYTLLNEEKKLCKGHCTSCEGTKQCLYNSLKVSKADDYLVEWRKECSRVLGLCDQIFAPSESVKKMYETVYPQLKDKIVVIEHGLNPQPDCREKVYVEPERTSIVRYSADSFFGTGQYSDMIAGWAVLEGYDNAMTKIYVDVFQPDGTKKRYETVKSERPDVDSALAGNGRYVNTGFYIGLHAQDCILDNFNAEIVIEYGGKYYCSERILSGVSPRPLLQRKKNIAFLGGMNYDKGSVKAYDVIMADKEENYNWYVLGGIDPSETLFGLSKYNVKKVGIYSRGEVGKLLEQYQIDLVCIFSVVSETFCYTLSEAYLNHVPVLAMDVGAVGERVKKLECGWTMDENCTTEELLEKINDIVNHPEEYAKVKEHIAAGEHKTTTQMAQEYEAFYKELYSGDVVYQKYDAKAFYCAYDVSVEAEAVESKYRKKAEELQQQLDKIENSFWYRSTKNLHLVNFPGKQKIRSMVYRILKKN